MLYRIDFEPYNFFHKFSVFNSPSLLQILNSFSISSKGTLPLSTLHPAFGCHFSRNLTQSSWATFYDVVGQNTELRTLIHFAHHIMEFKSQKPESGYARFQEHFGKKMHESFELVAWEHEDLEQALRRKIDQLNNNNSPERCFKKVSAIERRSIITVA